MFERRRLPTLAPNGRSKSHAVRRFMHRPQTGRTSSHWGERDFRARYLLPVLA
jgi:hypothetical protein